MSKLQLVSYDLSDCRTAHQRIYDVEMYDGEVWQPHSQLAVMRDAITHDGTHIHTIDYHGVNHTLLLRGKVDDPTFHARLDLTECGTAFVGTMSTGGGAPTPVRGTGLEQVYHTKRRPASDPNAPFLAWEDFTIKSAWVNNQLVITYLLGTQDVSDRVRVTKVDRPKGETTLEMVPQFMPPVQLSSFIIVLYSGMHTFDGTLVDDEENEYLWRGDTAPALAQARAEVFRAAHASFPMLQAMAAPSSTMSLQDLDNISSIQHVIDKDGKELVVDFATTNSGEYLNKGMINGLDQRWLDGIFGHPFMVPSGVQQVFNTSSDFFKKNSVLGTGMMLYNALPNTPPYDHLKDRMNAQTMSDAWKAMGSSADTGMTYQKATNDLYIQGYRYGVALMQPYLENNPEQWAEDYFNWLCDTNNLLTWQIQIASKMFDNVKTRMYEWYVKLQVLAPDKDYGQRFLTVAYAALLGVNYTRSQWSEDLKPFLQSIIEQAKTGNVDPTIMDQVQQQAAKENQELLRTLITTQDEIASLVDAISAALTSYQLKKNLQLLAQDPQLQQLIGNQLQGPQHQAWSELTAKGRAGGLLSMLFYGASAGYLIYSIAENADKPLTPRQIVEEVNMGVLAMAILTKGVEKMMSIGVGRFLENFSRAGQGGAFRTFAGDIATWFKAGGEVVPQGKLGRAFVAVFGESSAVFMARRIGPAMAVVGVVLSAYMLYDAIKSGTTRNIVFEALNTFFALADLVFIGLALLSFSWAGPVGLAIAVIGVIVILVQFIWGLIDPPPPPQDPITQFVNGPMVDKGYARA